MNIVIRSLCFSLIGAALPAALSGCDSGPPSTARHEETNGNDEEASDSVGAAVRDAGRKADARPNATYAGAGDKTSDEDRVPCDVDAITTNKCMMCHGTETSFGAPMSLVTLADYRVEASDGVRMADKVRARINERDHTKAMPPSSSPKLTTAELATLNAWLSAGTPAGKDTCESPTPDRDGVTQPDQGTDDLECYKLTAFGASASTPYSVGVATDRYVNFTFKAPWSGTAYGLRFSPIIANKQVLHHFLLFQDASAKAPGSSRSSGAHPDGQLIYGWAPGGRPLNIRENTDVSVGFELPGNTSYTVEMHYNSRDANAVDASGVEVCVAKKRPENIVKISWLGYDQLLIPSAKWTGTCVPENSVPVHILGVQPHMHVMGRHMKTVIHRKGGGDEVLLDEPFDFNDQKHYLKDVIINPGDSLTTECTFAQPMAFGESTGQEMCYNFVFAYPGGVLKDSGIWGGVAHGGSACLGQ